MGIGMDFPIFNQLFIEKENISRIAVMLEEYIEFKTPIFIDVNSFSHDDIDQLILQINSYCEKNKCSAYVPYPIYLVGEQIRERHFLYKNFVATLGDLPDYFRRKIFMKNPKQMAEMKKFLVYQYGIEEQDTYKILKQAESINSICMEMKKEKIKQYKLMKILNSFNEGRGNE